MKPIDRGSRWTARNRFGRLLRIIRTEAGYSLRGFALNVGLSPGYLSRVETGHERPPAVTRILQMAAVLKADPDELLYAAGKLDPALTRYICGSDRIVAFLRRAQQLGLTDDDFDGLIEELSTH